MVVLNCTISEFDFSALESKKYYPFTTQQSFKKWFYRFLFYVTFEIFKILRREFKYEISV
jgi:hypothetical protein